METPEQKTIRVKNLARVEGEVALQIRIEHGEVTDLRLNIFEPPRFFESFLRGRAASEAPDLTSRICGICPVAYQMSAVHAIERIYGIEIDPAVRLLRRLYYCGEWIESHALHIHMLAAPDFFGCANVIELAEKERAAVERGLRMKKAGNQIIGLLGGRSVHPVGACIGGFTRVPARADLHGLREVLLRVQDDALDCVRWVSAFDLPTANQDIESVSLRHPGEYPMNEGRIVSSKGIDIPQTEFDTVFAESQVPHSNALHAAVRGRGVYFLGPLARLNLNFDRLGSAVQSVARDTGIVWPNANPHTSIVARALEILYAAGEAIRVIDAYEPPAAPAASYEVRAGSGCAATEAPRGLLFHAYETDERGLLRSARIIPPTSQNQAQMEAELRALVRSMLDQPEVAITQACERVIRNYDPCISCATHFLRLELQRQ